MLALDTDVMIDIRRALPAAVAWFGQLTESPCLPGFVVMELVQGVKNKAELAELQNLISDSQVLWPTEEHSQKALNNFATLQLSYGLGLLDAPIAATVVGHNGTLCTFNLKHFRMVPGLATSQPYDRC